MSGLLVGVSGILEGFGVAGVDGFDLEDFYVEDF